MVSNLLIHLANKLGEALQTIWGWIVAVGLFVAQIFAGNSLIVSLVVAVTLMDAVWGIAVSVKNGRFALSELARLTIVKVAVYGCALFALFGIDFFIEQEHPALEEISISSSVVGIAIILTELWSSCASMLILFPDLPFLRLLSRALKGEIARKLNISEEDVEKELKLKKKPSNKANAGRKSAKGKSGKTEPKTRNMEE